MKLVVVAIVILSFGLAACGTTDVGRESPSLDGSSTTSTSISGGPSLTDRPPDFGFVLKYGINLRNVLNTLDGTFVKDLIEDGLAETSLRLTDDEMNSIHSEMLRIGLASYPTDLNAEAEKPTGPTTRVTPYSSYSIEVRANGQKYSVSWKDNGAPRTSEASAFLALVDQIQRMVEAKEEYQALPPARGGAA